MGVALSLWPNQAQPGEDAGGSIAKINETPKQAEEHHEQTPATGAALVQEAGNVTIQDRANVNVVGGDQTSITVNNTMIHVSNGEGPELAIEYVRKNLRLAKFTAIQRDVYHNRATDTGLWFLETPEFKEWWTREGRVLWATGMPGAGKTHVAACSIHHALQQAKANRKMSVSYGYFQYSDPKPTVEVLQSLVWQQAEYCPPGAELVAATIKQRKIEEQELSQEDCIDLLRYMSERCESWFFLDALDESPHDAQFSFLELCATIPAKVCIFSRPLMDMQHYLQESLGGCGITFATIVAQDKDIEILVNQKIDSTPALRRLLDSQPCLRERICQKVIKNARGMFVHAALQIEFIRHAPSIAQLEIKLAQFPRGLDRMYAKTMTRIEEQPDDLAELGKRVLLWVAHAERHLTVSELQHALATDVETEIFDENDIVPEDRILAACCGLVTLTSKKELRLVHMTALEAVRKFLHKWFPFPHSDITRVCIATLVSSGLPSGSLLEYTNGRGYLRDPLRAVHSRTPLLEYAHNHFALHLRRGINPQALALRERALAFLRQCTSFPFSISRTFQVIHATPIHVAAYCDIPDLLHSLLQQDRLDIDMFSLGSGNDQITPLMVASVFGNVEMVEYIQSLPGVNPNRKAPDGWTALHWAAFGGHEGVVSRLLDSVALDRNAQDNDGLTPLLTAISYRREPIAFQLLGTPGIDLTAVSTAGSTSLYLAIHHRCPDLAVKILHLEPGIDVNAHPNRSLPPLAWAAAHGYGAVVERLLADRRIRLLYPDVDLTPLTLSLERKHPDIARQLLAFPGVASILNEPNHHGWTPLMYASKRGYEDIVKHILAIGKQYGMNLKNVNASGDSALAIAFNSNQAAVARLFIEEDLGVNCWSDPDIQARFREAKLMRQWRIWRWEWVTRCLGQLQQWVRDGCPSGFQFQ